MMKRLTSHTTALADQLISDLHVTGVPAVFLLHADGTVEKWEGHATGRKALDSLRPLVDKMIRSYADD